MVHVVVRHNLDLPTFRKRSNHTRPLSSLLDNMKIGKTISTDDSPSKLLCLSRNPRFQLHTQTQIKQVPIPHNNVSLAPQFIKYTVNCTSRDCVSHLLTHLVVYIIARCSSLNTTTFCLIYICPVLPHPTNNMPEATHNSQAPKFNPVRKHAPPRQIIKGLFSPGDHDLGKGMLLNCYSSHASRDSESGDCIALRSGKLVEGVDELGRVDLVGVECKRE